MPVAKKECDGCQKLKKQIEEMEERLAALERKVEEKVDIQAVEEKVTETWAEKTRKVLNGSPGKIIYREMEERNDRKLNLVIRGIKESEEKEGLKRNEHDRREAVEVCSLTGVVEAKDINESILEVRRLGKHEPEKKYRPILIRLSRQDLRERLVRTGRRLRELNRRLDTRYKIEADLTKEQSENFRRMWQEAESQTGKGKKFYVTGPRENPVIRWREMTVEELGGEKERKEN